MREGVVYIHTDGACSGNPGPGGWAAILRWGGTEKELSGGERETTNNRMEMTAVIRALEALKEPCRVVVTTDSRYISDAVNLGWAKSWRSRGWKKKDGQAKNPDLWAQLLDLLEQHHVEIQWIKGHASDEFNNRCDALAVAESRKFIK